MTENFLLPRIISLLPISNGQLCRTKMFDPDYEYTDHFLDLRSFDEVMIVNVDDPSNPSQHDAYLRLVESVLPRCFLPLTLGGGIDSVAKAERLFELGADRIVVGSAALRDPALVERLAGRWGSQAVIGSVATKWTDGKLMAVDSRVTDGVGTDAGQAVRLLQACGAGEILVNSVDRDGSLGGMDVQGVRALAPQTEVPFLVAGGVGNWRHLLDGIRDLGASGIATSNIFHQTPESILAAKRFLADEGVPVRMPRTAQDSERP